MSPARPFALLAALAAAAAAAGCEISRDLRFEARDEAGGPLSGVAVTATSSERLTLCVPGGVAGGDGTGETGAEPARQGPHRAVAVTDENGDALLLHSLPVEPGYFPALLGAKPVGRQWIRLEWASPDGKRFASVVEMEPSGTGWAGLHRALFFDGYEGEGAFVEGPADVGNRIGFLVSTPFAFALSLPFLADDFSRDLVFSMGCYPGTRLSGIAAGAPSYALKKVFWDGPRALLGKDG